MSMPLNASAQLDEGLVAELVQVLESRLPELSPAELAFAGRLVAAAGTAVARLPEDELRRLAVDPDRLTEAFYRAAVSVMASASRPA